MTSYISQDSKYRSQGLYSAQDWKGRKLSNIAISTTTIKAESAKSVFAPTQTSK